ncbi:unnamed protein product [Cyprideis torosa]|uniref:Endonuclease/exonuclease/phosphatase domain-containing protein n=1 Tax=Cyprideis torosa TaxID=163714 RepID=A0A7R8ZML8_9CRUS|nr:unnamed protein product [Cyprideis torosa]CAG0884645.1 unnamed protein product [Cyprideis torosa]
MGFQLKSSSEHPFAISSGRLTIIGCYYQPTPEIDSIIDDIDIAINTAPNNSFIIGGDFNLQPDSDDFNELEQYLNARNIILASDPTVPTFHHPKGSSTLDHIFLSTSLENISTTVQPAADSDLSPVSITTKIPRQLSSKHMEFQANRKTNLESVKKILMENNESLLISSPEEFASFIASAVDRCSVTQKTRKIRKNSWYSAPLHALRKEMLRLLHLITTKIPRQLSSIHMEFHANRKTDFESVKEILMENNESLLISPPEEFASFIASAVDRNTEDPKNSLYCAARSSYHAQESLEILDALFNCDINFVGRSYAQTQKQQDWLKYRLNVSQSELCHTWSSHPTSQSSGSIKHILIKTIRLTITPRVKQWLVNSDYKIVHLFRDPRAVANSRRISSDFKSTIDNMCYPMIINFYELQDFPAERPQCNGYSESADEEEKDPDEPPIRALPRPCRTSQIMFRLKAIRMTDPKAEADLGPQGKKLSWKARQPGRIPILPVLSMSLELFWTNDILNLINAKAMTTE